MNEFGEYREENKKKMNRVKRIAIPAAAAILIVLFVILFCTVRINAGQIGLQTSLGKLTGKVYTEGTTFKLPFVTDVVKMNTQVQSMDEMQIYGEFSGRETVTLTVQMKYKLDESKAIDVYRNAGKYYINYLAPTTEIQEIIKSTVSQYTIDEFPQKREAISGEIKDKLNEKFNQKGVIFTSYACSNYEMNAALEQAMDERNAATMTLQTQKTNIEIEKERAVADKEIAKIEAEKAAETRKINAEAEAEAKRIAAQAEADAIRLKAEAEAAGNKAIAESLTPELNENLKWKQWNGSYATTITSGSVIMDTRTADQTESDLAAAPGN